MKKLSEKIRRAVRNYFAKLNMNSGYLYRRRGISSRTDPAAYPNEKKRIWINIVLFIATILSTTIAGSQSDESLSSMILSGLPFSMTLMAILLSHEMGHYLTARHFGVSATLPYFIPFPSIIGTMGAVIKLKSPINDRRSLLYIGALGPIAGFALSLIACIAGIYLSEIKPLPVHGDGLLPVFGDSLLFAFLVKIIHGSIKPGYDIYLSPYAWAGWIGFLVTSLNLMPMGQLDGSRVIYALIGRKQVYFGWTAFIGLIVLSFIWPGWIVWIIMALVFLMIGHPPIGKEGDLSIPEKAVGWLCIAIFILTFMPAPVNVV